MSTEQENPQEATDPNIGRVIEMAGNSRGEPRTATIVARKGTHYQLDVSDGTAAWIRADRVEKQTRAEQAGSASAHASDVIRRFQQSASAIPSLQERAARVMEDLDRIRAGLDPLPMTEAERSRILARCVAGPAPDADTMAAVQRNLAGKTPVDGHKVLVEAHVTRLMDYKRKGGRT